MPVAASFRVNSGVNLALTALQSENARLHRENNRLQAELQAHKGPTLASVQLENARLDRLVRKLQQDLHALRGEAIENRSAEASTQCSLPWVSPSAGYPSAKWEPPEMVEPPSAAGEHAQAADAPTTVDVADGADNGSESAGIHSAAPIAQKPPRPLARINARVEREWQEYAGTLLEPYLRSGAFAFVEAEWLVRAANRNEAHKLPIRQAMPPDAFITLNELKAAGCPQNALPILIVSAPWVTPNHPDPNGFHLQPLAKYLRILTANGQRYGVFWDFLSLHQVPENRYKRLDSEEEAFNHAMSGLALLYSHPYTTVLQLTRLPANYPDGYDLGQSANTSLFEGRGWCFTETMWATMGFKDLHRCLDLAKLDEAHLVGEVMADRKAATKTCACTSRRPPLLPAAFVKEMDSCTFTVKEDRVFLQDLYKTSFNELYCKAHELDFAGLGWTDTELDLLLDALQTGAFTNLRLLHLERNEITDYGMDMLAGGIGSGEIPKSCVVLCEGNPGSAARVIHATEQRAWHPAPRSGGRQNSGPAQTPTSNPRNRGLKKRRGGLTGRDAVLPPGLAGAGPPQGPLEDSATMLRRRSSVLERPAPSLLTNAEVGDSDAAESRGRRSSFIKAPLPSTTELMAGRADLAPGPGLESGAPRIANIYRGPSLGDVDVGGAAATSTSTTSTASTNPYKGYGDRYRYS